MDEMNHLRQTHFPGEGFGEISGILPKVDALRMNPKLFIFLGPCGF